MDYNLKLSGDDLNLIGEALSNMPYKTVNKLIQGLVNQVKDQEPKIIDNPEIKEGKQK